MTLPPTRQGVALHEHTPTLGGWGVQPFFLPSIYLGLGLLPSISSRYGWVLWTSFSLPLLLLLIPLLLPPLLFCFLSCPTLFPTIYYTMTIWRQLVFFLPSLSHPSPLLTASLWLLKCSSSLSRQEGSRVVLGRGAWRGKVARRPSL